MIMMEIKGHINTANSSSSFLTYVCIYKALLGTLSILVLKNPRKYNFHFTSRGHTN